MAYLDPINKYAEGIRHYNIFHKQLTRAWATTKVTSHRGESQHGCLEIPLPSFQANLPETVRWLVLILEPRASLNEPRAQSSRLRKFLYALTDLLWFWLEPLHVRAE